LNLLHSPLVDGRRVAVHGKEVAEALLESRIVRGLGRNIQTNELAQDLKSRSVREDFSQSCRLEVEGEKRHTFSSVSMPDSMSLAAPSTAMASTSSPSKAKKSEMRLGRVKLESA
jgi:hypothetical protein